MLPIGEITKRSGVAASALRYYESLGLISSSRQGSSRRFFPRSTLRRVAFIIFAQKIGYSLDEIGKQLARLPPTNCQPTMIGRRFLAAGSSRSRSINELQRLDMDLDHCIGCGCLSLQHCKLANPNDSAGDSGTGPRRWLSDEMPEQE